MNNETDMIEQLRQERIELIDGFQKLFRRFLLINGVNPNMPTRAGLNKIRAIVDSIEEERDEKDRHVQETLDDARNLGNP